MKLNDVAVRKAKPEAKPRKLSDGGGVDAVMPRKGSCRTTPRAIV